MSFVNQTIGDWTPAELQNFLQNVVQLEPSQLPPSFSVKTLVSAEDIVANGVTLTGDAPIVEMRAVRAAGIVPGSDQSNPQTIPDATFTKVHFTSHSNYNSTFDNPNVDQWTNNTDWVCPVDGVYMLQASVDWTSNATNVRRLVIQDSSAPENSGGSQGDANDKPYAFDQWDAVGNEHPQIVSAFAYIPAGTSLSVYAYQNSGAGLNIRVEENYSSGTRSRYATFSAVRVADSAGVPESPIV